MTQFLTKPFKLISHDGWGGANTHLANNADIVDKAGDEAAKAATKLGKSNHLAGEALDKMVGEAREAARAKAALTLKPRGWASKMFDGIRPLGDTVHGWGVSANAALEHASASIREGVDGLKARILLDRTSAAQKAKRAADLAAKMEAEAAMGHISQDTIDAAKAAKAETFMGKASAAVGDVLGKIKMPKMFGGSEGETAAKGVEEAGEVAAKVLPKLGWVFKGARWLGKAIPFVAVPVVFASQAYAAPEHGEAVDGEKLTYREQLFKDYITGRISHTKYEVYRQLQDHIALTGLGGIITGLICEGGQDAASQLDKASTLRYLQESALDAVRKATGNKLPDSVPYAATTPLTAQERLQRMQEVKQEMVDVQENKMLSGNNPVMALQGSMDMNVNWERVVRSVGSMPAAPSAPVTPTQQAALTHQQLVAAHQGVIEQAQMAIGRWSGGVEKMLGFNLGTGFSSVSKTSIGGFASTAQTGAAAQTAAQHTANA